jgi:adhesin/invasin
MADNGTVTTIVRGPAVKIDLAAYPDRIAPDGHRATIVAQVADDEGWNVADGTQVTFSTTLGTLDPLSGTTAEGLVTTTLTSGATTGIAQVQATANGVTEWISVEISIAPAYSLTVAASPYQVPADGVSTSLLTTHVYDLYGQPAPDGTQVVFVTTGDDMLMGSIEGREAYTTTISSGVATATYRSGTTPGWATIRAEIPPDSPTGEGEYAGGVRWAETGIRLGFTIYLPLILRQVP